jgi:hypothetical protein
MGGAKRYPSTSWALLNAGNEKIERALQDRPLIEARHGNEGRAARKIISFTQCYRHIASSTMTALCREQVAIDLRFMDQGSR